MARPSTLVKIVSGGQTGVDRAALDVALDVGIACGGWCPLGRIAGGPADDPQVGFGIEERGEAGGQGLFLSREQTEDLAETLAKVGIGARKVML